MTTIFEELGVRPVINAQGNRTLLGGGTPSPEVREMMDAAEDYYVNLSELMDAVGERISDMLDVEAALVTSGCSAALAYAARSLHNRKRRREDRAHPRHRRNAQRDNHPAATPREV